MELASLPLVFIAASTLASVVLGLIWGSVTSEIAGLSLLAGFAGALYASGRSRAKERPAVFPGPAALFWTGLFVALSLRYFLWIYFYDGEWKTFEIVENRLPSFLAAVANFAHGQKFWPENPLIAAEPYHDFGMALFTGLAVKLGIPASAALPAIGLVAAAVSAFLLWEWARETGIGGTLFLGGTAGLLILASGHHPQLQEYLSQKTAFVSALPFMVFVSYPGFLFAFPAGLYLLVSFRRRFLEGMESGSAYAETLLWAALPLFDLHTFLGLSFLFLGWGLFSGRAKETLSIFLRACLAAAPLVLASTNFLKQPSVLFAPHWKDFSFDGPVWTVVLREFGYFLPWLGVLLLAAVFSRGKKYLWAFTLPAALAYLFLVFFEISPWKDAGLPLLAWCYVLLLVPLNEQIVRRAGPLGGALILAALFFPGIVLHRQTYNGYFRNKATVSIKDQEAICSSLAPLPRTHRFATSTDPRHPIPVCGFPVVSIYNEALFLWNTPQRQNSEKLHQLLRGDKGWRERAAELDVRYIFVGQNEKQDMRGQEPDWQKAAKQIRSEAWGSVYDLGSPDPLRPLPEPGQGLRATFFANKTFEGEPLMVKTAKIPDFNWDEAERDILGTPFGILLEGEIYVPQSQEVTFYLASDDGSILEIGGEIVVDNGGDHSLRIKYGKKYLEQGWHPLRLRYHDDWGVSYLSCWWKPALGKEEMIPAELLRPPQTKEGA
ncbi:MAG TPA: PA14 domain-containing protein [Verrucomicrobiae bacterium]|nr:PA14 domain-containing protein [Verrucomicrobiae bacterium]